MFSDVFPGVTLVRSIQMELQKTFWSKLYGSVTDKFGITWQFNLNNN